jgi:hypothetical protein
MRAGLAVAGCCLLIPGEIGPWALWTDLAGAGLAAVLLAIEWTAIRPRPAAVRPAE